LADAPEDGLEHRVSVAIVKPDHEPALRTIIDGVNLLADAIAITNPVAGLAVRTGSVLSGWVWNRWKFDRVSPVLEAVSTRIQRVESDYVRQDEFADLLEDALRRISEQPSSDRRSALTNALLRIVEEPQDHVRNRWFLRCADELDGDALFLLNVLDELKTLPFKNPAMSWASLVERTGRGKPEIHETLGRLSSEHLVDAEGVFGLLRADQAPSPYRVRLTRRGADLLRYIREGDPPETPRPSRRRAAL
jgi:hypothetical protein